MLTLWNGTAIKKEDKEKISERLLSFFGAKEIVCVLPGVNKALKHELETTYAQLREQACEKVLIYKHSIKPCLMFSSDVNADSFKHIKLSGGYSNFTYKVSIHGGKTYISRIPGAGSESFIDRSAEWHNASIASELGLNPAIEYNDKKGSQLSECLLTPCPLTPTMLQQHSPYIIEIALQLKKLHRSPNKFQNDANIFKRNTRFRELIEQHHVVLPDEYEPIRKITAKLELIFQQLNIPQVPCHNDTYYNNFLLNEGKIWLIDWEYSGNHDAIWDLAYFSKLASLNEEQNTCLLEAYFNCQNVQSQHPLEYLRFIAYRIVINEFLILWTFVQIANKNTTVSEAELNQWSGNALKDSQHIMINKEFNEAVSLLEKAAQEYQSDSEEALTHCY
jgi:thiamine kinase-like enzyme